jgi:small subunit ribosomal protein S15
VCRSLYAATTLKSRALAKAAKIKRNAHKKAKKISFRDRQELAKKRSGKLPPFDTRPIPEGTRLQVSPDLLALAAPDVLAALDLHNATKSEVMSARVRNLAVEIGGSIYNTGSAAVQVCVFTEHIINLTDHLRSNRQDTSAKLQLSYKVEQRRKMLNYLQRRDFFTWQAVCTKLGLKTTPQAFHKEVFRIKDQRTTRPYK